MYKEQEYRERCAARGLDEAATARALEAVRALEAYALPRGGTPADIPLAKVEEHIADLVATGRADEQRIVAMARYFMVTGVDAVAIRLLAYLLPVGVLPAMMDRLAAIEGDEVGGRVSAAFAVPPIGAPPEAYPEATARFVRALQAELGDEKARRVLTWNVHGIPAAGLAPERERFRELGSIDAWLADHHKRQVEILRKHAADGTLWYEQRITQAVVDFVDSHPEILGGVRDGDTIFVTKIPYDPDRYIASGDPLERRKLACHCPLAASSIVPGGAGVPAIWCACSAGYEKFVFDVTFDEETEATVLATALAGDELCRYAVKIPERLRR